MVSSHSGITDAKGRPARSGWVFYDADCAFCTAWARRLGPVIEPRGFALAPLQDPRVRELLALSPEELLLEMRVLTPDGRQFSGADAFIYLTRQVWWARPFYALAMLPGMRAVLRAGYRWIAARRSCAGVVCAVKDGDRSAQKDGTRGQS